MSKDPTVIGLGPVEIAFLQEPLRYFRFAHLVPAKAPEYPSRKSSHFPFCVSCPIIPPVFLLTANLTAVFPN